MDCCNQRCNQGRSCPVRSACELPEDDFDPSKPNVLATCAAIALIVLAFAVICAAPFLIR